MPYKNKADQACNYSNWSQSHPGAAARRKEQQRSRDIKAETYATMKLVHNKEVPALIAKLPPSAVTRALRKVEALLKEPVETLQVPFGTDPDAVPPTRPPRK